MNSRFLRRCGGARGPLGSDGLSGRAGVIARHFAWPVVFGVAMALTAGKLPAVEIPAGVRAAERVRIEAIARGSRAAVAIFAGEAGGGSGVLVSADGYALTNFHVVQPAGVAMKCGLSDGRLYDAVLVGLDGCHMPRALFLASPLSERDVRGRSSGRGLTLNRGPIGPL